MNIWIVETGAEPEQNGDDFNDVSPNCQEERCFSVPVANIHLAKGGSQ